MARAFAALVTLCASAGAHPVTMEASIASPSLLWAGAKRLAVNCLVHTSTGDSARLQAKLCDRVQSLAARSAPMPVLRAEAGDPAFIQSDTVILLVHASVERKPSASTIAFTIRPYRASGGEAEAFYGTAPRAMELASASIEPALEAALSAAIAEILPWQQQSVTARPL